MSKKAFASQGDLEAKTISFTQLGEGLYAFTTEGDPNTGIIIGDDGVMVIDTQATPVMAKEVLTRIREVTDKPVKYVVLSHYHAVRVLGAVAYQPEQIIASAATHSLIHERGQEDWDSEYGRFPRLFQAAESIPGLTWPSLTFTDKMTVYLGKRRVEIMHLGRAHTAGDTVVWIPDSGVMFSGDTVEYRSACYCGDAHFRDWPETLGRLKSFNPQALVPGRGDALTTPDMVAEGIHLTQSFLNDTYAPVAAAAAKGWPLKDAFAACRDACDPKYSDYAIYEHCLPFNVARAYDEANGIDHPRIWTAQRDQDMWEALQQ
ncbi:MAG: MBL fold metallo-hydrolase [SAR324 cluster bacterium]|jgi:glyoxylase-like metal-dependent hydrolase (beta-lactamase superfamily II)|nr:MBL fold metallo-hydrolase [Deltaproteobacteria bacterium]MDE0906760.1 MBL fold metallo-hydrolase [SAR324 cluster bacterium]MEC7418187.1 MBL fold metallo-hydrolase [SAR324 cluster bacterium]HIF69367.1 MBL fold metallo-hydrolase [Candidatus Lambdaproteobacteria bacterium]HIL15297.1 MBL fold metallo-hydrolase [Deltaproteobacteria bacterium]